LDKKNVDLALELVGQDILMLRSLMNEVSEQVDSLSNPILVKISQIMDTKLNQRNQLLLRVNSSRGALKKLHLRMIKQSHLS
jgi:hypothetical protein